MDCLTLSHIPAFLWIASQTLWICSWRVCTSRTVQHTQCFSDAPRGKHQECAIQCLWKMMLRCWLIVMRKCSIMQKPHNTAYCQRHILNQSREDILQEFLVCFFVEMMWKNNWSKYMVTNNPCPNIDASPIIFCSLRLCRLDWCHFL